MCDNIGKRRKKGGWLRLTLVALSVLLQALFILLLSLLLKDYAALLYMLLQAGGILLALVLIVRRTSPGYTIAWMLILLSLPVMGMLLYLSWGSGGFSLPEMKDWDRGFARMQRELTQDEDIWRAFCAEQPAQIRSAMVLKARGFVLYRREAGAYYPSGEAWFAAFFEVLQKARRFIFLSFFILEEGELWRRTREILVQKAAQGVDVRLLYDDMGCVATLPRGFVAALKRDGIKAAAFNPIHRYMQRLCLNYRNHQKIVVADGVTALTGGVNIGDAYANLQPRYGHWKDTGVLITGAAVRSLSAAFLQMWEASAGRLQGEYSRFWPQAAGKASPSDGYIVPFVSGPGTTLKGAAEDVYRLMASTARQYVYYTTPYLALDYTFQETLRLAARGGVDVRIITPGIPDHKSVYIVTRSHYRRLLEGGVRIFEYTPGFIHAKMALCDGECAVIGTVNMDSRSFYQHYENAVWLCNTPEVGAVRQDFETLFPQCEEIKLEQWIARPPLTRAVEGFFNLFSPLM